MRFTHRHDFILLFNLMYFWLTTLKYFFNNKCGYIHDNGYNSVKTAHIYVRNQLQVKSYTYITFISPRIYKSSCIANFSESWWAMIHLNFVSLTLGETLCDDEAEWISWPNLILSFPVLSIDHEIKRSTACEPKKKLKLGIRSLSRLSK